VASESHDQILVDAKRRAQALHDAMKRDASELAKSSRFADGAACCEDVAEQARRLIDELDARPGGNSDS
jgi:hypothetical protein